MPRIPTANLIRLWRTRRRKSPTWKPGYYINTVIVIDVVIVHRVLIDIDERLSVCFTMESFWGVDRDVSTALLLVLIRRWGQLFTCRYMENLGSLLLVHFDPHSDWMLFPQWETNDLKMFIYNSKFISGLIRTFSRDGCPILTTCSSRESRER